LIEVIVTSKIDALDQAAVRALELSLPFPALPADFPASNVEVYFIFQYGY
jgi:outer membrane biosynthesis protein TonB